MIKYHCIKCDTNFTKANLTLKPMCPLCGVDVEVARAKAEPVELQEDEDIGFASLFDDDAWFEED